MSNTMYRYSVYRQDAEPKNGLVNQIWEKSMSSEMFKPFSVRELNGYPTSMLEYILSTLEDATKPQNKSKKKVMA